MAGIWLWGRWSSGEVMRDQEVALPMVWLVLLFFRVWIVSEACARLSEDRRSGALELLLSTPLSEREVVRGQWLALRRQFLKPVLVFLALEFWLMSSLQPVGWLLAGIPLRLLEFAALGWVGMWLGLTMRSVTRAILGTLGLILILPRAVAILGIQVLQGIVPGLGWSGPWIPGLEPAIQWSVIVANHLIWGWVWARGGLRHRFRRVAVRSHEGLRTTGWRWRRGPREGEGAVVMRAA
jgi:hypothetical protein